MIVDLKMPGMDGLQVLEEAKKLQPDVAVRDHDRLRDGRHRGRRR